MGFSFRGAQPRFFFVPKKSPEHGLNRSFLVEKLRSLRGRHSAIAIKLTSGKIIRTYVGNKSTRNLLEFLFTQKAGASPAQYSGALQVRH